MNSPTQGIPQAKPILIPTVNSIIAVLPQPDLYERLKRIPVVDFKGSSDPLVTGEWLSRLQVILDFMNLTN